MEYLPVRFNTICQSVAVLSLMLPLAALAQKTETTPKPLMKDFMGLCVHTVQFKPPLYKPVCRLVRDYHGMNWDVGDDTDFWPVFPFARNQVNWETMYADWKKEGFIINASIMIDTNKPETWKNIPRDANTYGFALGRFFGPANRNLLESVEIGNEPGMYTDEIYRQVFENMARGVRAGDGQMKIATCAVTAGKSHRYAKSVECFKGLEPLYDVINVHSYAEVEGWPTWRRSYPEDPAIAFLKDIRSVIDWRNQNAPGKAVWLTEFGWDCSTKPAPKEGTFKDWQGSTDTQQANYLVRAWLILAEMDIQRAYSYWFNDNDEPQVHGAAGLTRGYQPKPSYYAVAHLFQTLGEYRFSRIISNQPERFVYEFSHGSDPKRCVWVVWNPTAADQPQKITLAATGIKTVEKAERMPMTDKTEKEDCPLAGGQITLNCGQSPVYLFVTME